MMDMEDDDPLYADAKKEKIKELRKLMQELMADGDDPMSMEDLTDTLQEAGNVAEDNLVDDADAGDDVEEMAESSEEESDELSGVGEGEGEEEEAVSDLEKMKRDYFRPKPKNTRRPGTAVVMPKMEAKPTFGISQKAKGGKLFKARTA